MKKSLHDCSTFVNRKMDASFPHIHYSDSYWNVARTIWGAEEKGINYEYSDRLEQWDYAKAENARKQAWEKHKKFNPAYIQEYLTLYYDKPVLLCHVMGGVNIGNGYNYYVYGFKFLGELDAS